jgi:hypothetical protein
MDIAFKGAKRKEIWLERIDMKDANFLSFTVCSDFFNPEDMFLFGFKEPSDFKDIVLRDDWFSDSLDPAAFNGIAANRGISQPVSAIRFGESLVTGDNPDGDLGISWNYFGPDLKKSISRINF